MADREWKVHNRRFLQFAQRNLDAERSMADLEIPNRISPVFNVSPDSPEEYYDCSENIGGAALHCVAGVGQVPLASLVNVTPGHIVIVEQVIVSTLAAAHVVHGKVNFGALGTEYPDRIGLTDTRVANESAEFVSTDSLRNTQAAKLYGDEIGLVAAGFLNANVFSVSLPANSNLVIPVRVVLAHRKNDAINHPVLMVYGSVDSGDLLVSFSFRERLLGSNEQVSR